MTSEQPNNNTPDFLGHVYNTGMTTSIIETLLGCMWGRQGGGGVCPLLHTPFSFCLSSIFSNFHCSFFIVLCSQVPFNFFLLLPDNFFCSLLRFTIFSCSLLQSFVLPVASLPFPCSLIYFGLCCLFHWISKGRGGGHPEIVYPC